MMQFIHLKHIVQWFLVKCTELCNHHNLILDIFITHKMKPIAHPLPPPPSALGNQ